MGIASAIARVRKVRAAGIPSVVAELGGQLRSDSIPARLRPAAARIADLLKLPEPQVERAAPASERAGVAVPAPQAVEERPSSVSVAPVVAVAPDVSMTATVAVGGDAPVDVVSHAESARVAAPAEVIPSHDAPVVQPEPEDLSVVSEQSESAEANDEKSQEELAAQPTPAKTSARSGNRAATSKRNGKSKNRKK